MIFERYKKLEKIALEEFGDIINESFVIFSFSGRARKLRLKLVDKTFVDIWTSIAGEYSFHWEQRGIRNGIYRHDNAPHKKWRNIKTFPKHCHDGAQGHVVESYIADEPENGISDFLFIVRERLIENNITSTSQ
ncbi:MAG: hypothetical protein GWP15_03095 [Nitrospirae bacterium]|nr:hypothetical protein [Nitrospirota bacterium]